MPEELMQAEMVESLAQRYHCLPSAVLAESAWLLEHVALLGLAGWGERGE